jgi:hypothetical protein
MAQPAMSHSTTNDGLLVAILAQRSVLNSSTSPLVLAKPPPSCSHGFGIVFNSKIRSGRAASFIACRLRTLIRDLKVSTASLSLHLVVPL